MSHITGNTFLLCMLSFEFHRLPRHGQPYFSCFSDEGIKIRKFVTTSSLTVSGLWFLCLYMFHFIILLCVCSYCLICIYDNFVFDDKTGIFHFYQTVSVLSKGKTKRFNVEGAYKVSILWYIKYQFSLVMN